MNATLLLKIEIRLSQELDKIAYVIVEYENHVYIPAVVTTELIIQQMYIDCKPDHQWAIDDGVAALDRYAKYLQRKTANALADWHCEMMDQAGYI